MTFLIDSCNALLCRVVLVRQCVRSGLYSIVSCKPAVSVHCVCYRTHASVRPMTLCCFARKLVRLMLKLLSGGQSSKWASLNRVNTKIETASLSVVAVVVIILKSVMHEWCDCLSRVGQ